MDNKANKKNNNITTSNNPFREDFSNFKNQTNINNKELNNNISKKYI